MNHKLPVSALAFLTALSAAPLAADTVKLTLLGVGDLYNFAEDDGRGGFARVNAVARAERAANPNMLYVFDGDMLSPSIQSGFDKGQNTIDFTNLVPFDLAVPGNHEFDFGAENFVEKIKASKYPWAAVMLLSLGAAFRRGCASPTVPVNTSVRAGLRGYVRLCKATLAGRYQNMVTLRIHRKGRQMAKNTSVALGDHFTRFLAEQVATGRYGSASEVLRAGLRLLEEREAALEELRAEIDKGEASGIAEGFDIRAFIARKRAEHAA